MHASLPRIDRCHVARAAALCAGGMLAAAAVAAPREGRVVDLGGRPLQQAMVTIVAASDAPGASAVTVFSDQEGRFRFPETVSPAGEPQARKLGYRPVETLATGGETLTIVMRPESNLAGVAPASAWLGQIARPEDRTAVVMTCVGCHQIPGPEVREYAALIHDLPVDDRDTARRQSWHSLTQYMNYLSAWEFGRGGEGGPPEAQAVYSGGEADSTAALLARTLTGAFEQIEGYEYGAPLLATGRTVIREYEVPRPNAIREALTLQDPGLIWVADVSTNRIFRIDAVTGARRPLEVPSDVPVGPHTLVRGEDGALWVAPFFNGIVARLDPGTERWQTWKLTTQEGGPVGVHDLTFDSNHDLMADRRGRIWFSDIVNNAVGWFDPRTGESGVHRIPPVPGREGNEQLYGIVMDSDRTRVWYSQLGIGVFGSFNVETEEFETVVQLPDRNAGPRRLAITADDVLYVPLYGAGQLVEYDTRAREIRGVYDLPDRASAPYAVTWDERRGVLWIPTSNANAIYRFDPRDDSFAVLPLPREGAFLRMLSVDERTGALVTSYANIVENVHGPRMAVVIDLGDGASEAAGAPAARQAARVGNTGAVGSAAPAASAPRSVPELLAAKRCNACHALEANLLGPPYVAIALRHRAEREPMIEVLARKIVLGGGGTWGVVPMVPNEHVTLDEARAMARWILERQPPADAR